jgi:hypothetical protein
MRWHRRTPEPVPLAVRHRRDWRRWWRYCTCGQRWRCPDKGRAVIVEPPYPMVPPNAPVIAEVEAPPVPPEAPPPTARQPHSNAGPGWTGQAETEAASLAQRTRAQESRSLIRGGRW